MLESYSGMIKILCLKQTLVMADVLCAFNYMYSYLKINSNISTIIVLAVYKESEIGKKGIVLFTLYIDQSKKAVFNKFFPDIAHFIKPY